MRQGNIKLVGGIRRDCRSHIFEQIISLDNLILAWHAFRRGKSQKLDVQRFEFNLEDNLFKLHCELKDETYRHGKYFAFWIRDPKLRRIHKARVRDRVLHHAIFRVLYPIFDKQFIFDSYSCRLAKGTHRAVGRLQQFIRRESQNRTRSCFVLKCDVKKFFDSIDHAILLDLVAREVSDKNVLWLVGEIIDSFAVAPGKGLPLGNITSQLLASIYLNELDRFVKHSLKTKYYLRYCDDFIILSANRSDFDKLVKVVNNFLGQKIGLLLHPAKVEIRDYRQGIDFLGYVSFPHYCVLRTTTKRRMFRKLRQKLEAWQQGRVKCESFCQSRQSYLGLLSHCSAHKSKIKMDSGCARAYS
ncbi:MAG: hypothetical protein COY09_01195 [Candidatus Portnoybacteria bacterium CG_4_10_14_0_2_um_filter_39_11]|uniref:Reverse transcriptase domain-containing protein n=1 Tax=Candidatus Portnoybacteria bacterium CG_4_10_14_0_2_um_filter_39_11 TaxID=1974797 RepID=A0A2M7UIW2_9BACT|nr:MAG: hypothetical protein AUJ33_00340 [Parcubacteria group bacterium CG1_02_40_25]PIZ71132.1 MAG: hypothetical protein COY09_01195 [Candidatus Portnoybacteria bacterium CG_4_10_14_0_2_um_filter_39_11]